MEWLAAFLAAHPQVRVDFVLSDARADLIADRIDVAIRGGVLEDSGLFARRVLDAGLDGLVASPAYIAARGTPATLQDLADHDCLGRPPQRTRDLAPVGARRHRRRGAGGWPAQRQHRAGAAQGRAGGAGHRAAAVADDAPGTARRPAGAGAPAVPPQGPRRASGLRQPPAPAPAVSAFIDLVATRLGEFEDLPMKTPGTPA
jgi:DNA-binding transcriptional LysR family regulator